MPTEFLWQAPAAALAIGYLLGSIPFGLILTRLAGSGDLRQIGSGSIGATNVLRTGRKGLAALTLLLDSGKGAAAVVIAQALDPSLGPLGGLAAFVGHCWPLWLGFKGGKGVATAFGVLLALAWPIALACAGAWAAAVLVFRISSVGGLSAAAAAPVAATVLGRPDLFAMLLGMALLIGWKHRPNIGRLVNGTEPRIGRKNA